MSQTTSPDHAAVIEHSEQFLVHLKAALSDPKLKRGNEVTAEIKELVEELKSVQPKDRKKLTKEGISGTFRGVVSEIGRMTSDGVTTLGTMSFQQFKPTEWKVKTEGTTMDIGQTSERQYQVNIPFTFQDGPLKGEKAIQSTVGEYSLDDNEPSKQNIGITGVVLRPGSTDAAYLDKWKDIMKKENESMDDNGEVKWTAPEPMKGFRDFLYFDDQLQVSIGNLGSLTIMQK